MLGCFMRLGVMRFMRAWALRFGGTEEMHRRVRGGLWRRRNLTTNNTSYMAGDWREAVFIGARDFLELGAMVSIVHYDFMEIRRV